MDPSELRKIKEELKNINEELRSIKDELRNLKLDEYKECKCTDFRKEHHYPSNCVGSYQCFSVPHNSVGSYQCFSVPHNSVGACFGMNCVSNCFSVPYCPPPAQHLPPEAP